jgi:hypoxanthine-guanine phosphoribosyltransferase
MCNGVPSRRLVRTFPREEIASVLRRLAGEVNRDYRDRPPLLVGILMQIMPDPSGYMERVP